MEFYTDKYNKVYCSRTCADTYNKTKKKGMPSVKEQGIEPLTYYRSYVINGDGNLNTTEKKKAHRQELGDAMVTFLENGGKIEKLPPSPLPKIPSVGSRDWEWEITVGLGFFGADEIVEPNDVTLTEEMGNAQH